VATGDFDQIECVLKRMGFEQFDLYNDRGAGNMLPANIGEFSALIADPAKMAKYNIIVVNCTNAQFEDALTPAALVNLEDYVGKGGLLYATDWAYEAVSLVERNAETNGLRIAAAVVDWRAPPPPGISGFDVVLAADVLYEERNAVPLLAMLAAATSGQGTVLIADPGRRYATGFFERAGAGGWSIEPVPTLELPAGGIAILRRAVSAGATATLC